jgi:hypothetical protein
MTLSFFDPVEGSFSNLAGKAGFLLSFFLGLI